MTDVLADVLAQRGWTYRELARRAGIGISTARQAGASSQPETRRKIVQALGMKGPQVEMLFTARRVEP